MGIEPMLFALPRRCFTTKLRRRFGAEKRYSVRGSGPYYQLGNGCNVDQIWLSPPDLSALPILRRPYAQCSAKARVASIGTR